METQEEKIILDKIQKIHPNLVMVDMDFRYGESVIVYPGCFEMNRSEFMVNSETYALLEEWEKLRL